MAGRGSISLAFRLAPVSARGATALPAAEIGDADDGGAVVWDDCAGCHEIGPGAENAIGPTINGTFDRRAARLDDFDCSKSLTRAGREDGPPQPTTKGPRC